MITSRITLLNNKFKIEYDDLMMGSCGCSQLVGINSLCSATFENF